MIKITQLIDDNIPFPLHPEHGLALWVEVRHADGSEARLLLDTGQHATVLEANAARACVDLTSATAVVLSHGHYDHTGGLPLLASLGVRCPVFIGVDAERRRFSTQVGVAADGRKMLKQIGMPCPEALKSLDVTRVSGIVGASSSLTLFSLPTAAPANVRLLAADGVVADTFSDEVFALISDGVHSVLFGGCTHHGLPLLLGFLKDNLGVGKVDLFVGGLHLQGQPEENVVAMADAVAGCGVGRWMAIHCSGDVARKVWSERFSVVDNCVFSL